MPAKVKFFDGTHNFTFNYPKESGNETGNRRLYGKKEIHEPQNTIYPPPAFADLQLQQGNPGKHILSLSHRRSSHHFLFHLLTHLHNCTREYPLRQQSHPLHSRRTTGRSRRTLLQRYPVGRQWSAEMGKHVAKSDPHRLLPSLLPEPVGFLSEWTIVRPTHSPGGMYLRRKHPSIFPASVHPNPIYRILPSESATQPDRVHSFRFRGRYQP